MINNLQLAILTQFAMLSTIFVLGFIFGHYAFPKNTKPDKPKTNRKNEDIDGVVS